jgi:hypothetical protein
MTGEEGLRGWLNRNVCQLRYGVKFYVPQSVDFTHSTTSDMAHCLQIIVVDKNSTAERTGLKSQDRIVAIDQGVAGQSFYIDILNSLANDAGPTSALSVRRLDEQSGKFEELSLALDTTWKKDLKGRLAGIAKKAATLVPAEQTNDSKAKAIFIIIIAIGIVTVVRCTAKFYQSYLAEKIVQVGIKLLREVAYIHEMDMPMSFVAER